MHASTETVLNTLRSLFPEGIDPDQYPAIGIVFDLATGHGGPTTKRRKQNRLAAKSMVSRTLAPKPKPSRGDFSNGTHAAQLVKMLRKGPATAAQIREALGGGTNVAANTIHRLRGAGYDVRLADGRYSLGT